MNTDTNSDTDMNTKYSIYKKKIINQDTDTTKKHGKKI